MNHKFFYLIFLLSVLNTVKALPEDKLLPFTLSSDSAHFDKFAGLSIYEGNVLLSQGTMEIHSSETRVYHSDVSINYVESSGSITMKYLPDVQKPWIHGFSEKIHFDVKNRIITLTGNAKIMQGDDEITGDIMTYDVNNNVVHATGHKKKQVRIEIQANDVDRNKQQKQKQ